MHQAFLCASGHLLLRADRRDRRDRALELPLVIPFGEVAIALMAGNGVVLKPASLTPLMGERIRQVFERGGVPQGLIRVVHGPGTGEALVRSDVAKVFFTGSVETGRDVGEDAPAS